MIGFIKFESDHDFSAHRSIMKMPTLLFLVSMALAFSLNASEKKASPASNELSVQPAETTIESTDKIHITQETFSKTPPSNANKTMGITNPVIEPGNEKVNADAPPTITSRKAAPTGRELIQQSLEEARLMAEIERRQELFAKRPRRKFISASTQAPAYRSYMQILVRELEELGNANYPEELKRKKISGQVTATIAIARDKSLVDVTINKSSGISILDAAILNIVNSAAPFPPIPVTDDDIDILHITRTWYFYGGD